MSILIASDIHEHFDRLIRHLKRDHIKACICCGDLTIDAPKHIRSIRIPKPIYTVYGNNERFSLLTANIPNLIWMDAGKIYEVGGLKIAGMGGVMSKSPRDPRHYSIGEVEASLSLEDENIDIFVAHHPPKLYADLCNERYRNHCGSPDTLKIMSVLQPKIFLAGHLHWFQLDIFGDNGVVRTYVITMGRFGYGDYGILTSDILTLYKKGVKCFDVYWRNNSSL